MIHAVLLAATLAIGSAEGGDGTDPNSFAARLRSAEAALARGETRVAVLEFDLAIVAATSNAEEATARTIRLEAVPVLPNSQPGETDVARLHELLARPLPQQLARRSALAIANWHRLNRAGVDTPIVEREGLSLQALDLALELSSSPLERAEALELRSLPYSALHRFDAAEADLAEADRIYGEASDTVGRARCLRRGAYTACRRGDFARALELLAGHRPLIPRDGIGELDLTELRTHEYLEALANLGVGDIDGASRAIHAYLDCSALLLVDMPWPFVLRSHEQSAPAMAILIGRLLTHSETHPAESDRAFDLAVAIAENAKARLLRAALEHPPAVGAASRAPVSPQRDDIAILRYLEVCNDDQEDRRYVLLGQRGTERFWTAIRSVAELDSEIDHFLGTRLTTSALHDTPAAYAADASALATILLGPALGWIRGDGAEGPNGATRVRRIVLIADGSFARLPFDALVLSRADQARSFAELDYLVRHAAIVHLPSLGVLDALAEPASDDRVVALLAPTTDLRHVNLRFAAVEERALRAAHAKVDVLVGSNATRSRLLDALHREPAGWIHLACHAEPDPAFRNSAVLRLAEEPGGAGGPDAGALKAIEILDLPLTPGVRVVLSACGTAEGDYLRGEGVLGVWRAFLAAGASCVVSTLREVDDRSAATWMAAFHRHAASGTPLAEAARLADLAWLDGAARPTFPRGVDAPDSAHPALWAAYLCLGDDGGPMPRTRSN